MQTVQIFGFSLYQLLSYLLIFSFVGWVLEVINFSIKKRKFINRGFLNGPWCPIYGVGATLLIVILTPITKIPNINIWLSIFLVFITSVIIATILEFIVGYLLEKIFKQRWWNYSNDPFNIKGYVKLTTSLLWGVLAIIVIFIVLPPITSFLKWVNPTFAEVVLYLYIISFVTDMIVTTISLSKFASKLKSLEKISQMLKKDSNNIGEKISEFTIHWTNKYEEGLKKRGLSEKRLLKAFPNVKSRKYQDELDDVLKKTSKDNEKPTNS